MKPQLPFNSPARLAYDLSSSTSNNFYIDPSQGKNLMRRIVTSAVDTPPAVDGPASHLAVGQFNFSSDAFLVHPTGVLVSLDSGAHCIEVLRPSATPVPDALAPLAYTRSSKGTREGLVSGPVCAAIAPNGAILMLESRNLGIQAFDTDANPVRMFGGTLSFLILRSASSGATFLDVAMESVGYVYVLYKSATHQFILRTGSTNFYNNEEAQKARTLVEECLAWFELVAKMRATALPTDFPFKEDLIFLREGLDMATVESIGV